MNIKPDIDLLLSQDDTDSVIIELDIYVCNLCDFGEDLDSLNEQQLTFYLNQNLEREMNNGGFDQFFFNSAGNNAHETVESLTKIGAHKTAAILQQAIDQFPGKQAPANQTSRQNIMEEIVETANPAWAELDTQFFEYQDDLNALNIAFIKAHNEAL